MAVLSSGSLRYGVSPSSMDAPMAGWVRMTSNSSGVRRPGLLRMFSGMLILPMSCRAEAVTMRRIFSSVRWYTSVFSTSLRSSIPVTVCT